MRLEHKRFAISELKAGDTAGKFTGKASVYGVVDSYGDIVMPGAFTKTLQQKGNRVKVLAQHNPEDVIGFATVQDKSDALYAEGQLVLDLPSAKDMYTRLSNGLIDGMSIGYITNNATYDKNGLRQLNEIDLWEISLVTFPANDYARVQDVKSSIVEEAAELVREMRAGRMLSSDNENRIRTAHKALQEIIDALDEKSAAAREQKGVLPFSDLPLADDNYGWDASAAEKRIRDWAGAEDAPNAKYKKAFVWYDAENPDKFGSYKLGIGDVTEGKLVAVPRGIFAVAGVLSGARGGVDISEADQEKAKAHIGRYYKKMGKVAPWDEKSESAGSLAHQVIETLRKLNAQ